MNLSEFANPYDFGRPVSERRSFSGREAVIRDIQYYIAQGIITNRPVSLAVIGERASGKTSVLNMIALEAKDKGCCVARLDLDNSDAASQANFFFQTVR